MLGERRAGTPDASPGPWTLVFDGDCGFCRAVVDRVRRRDRDGRIDAFPLQDDRRLAATGISREEAEREMWLVAPDGRRWGGAEAASRILRLLPGGAPFGGLLDLAPVRPLARAAYRWIAEHRPLVSRITRTGDACPLPPPDATRAPEPTDPGDRRC